MKQYFDTKEQAEEYKRKHGLTVLVAEYLPAFGKYALIFPIKAHKEVCIK